MPARCVFLPANGGFPTKRRTPGSPARTPPGTRSPSGTAPAAARRAATPPASRALLPPPCHAATQPGVGGAPRLALLGFGPPRRRPPPRGRRRAGPALSSSAASSQRSRSSQSATASSGSRIELAQLGAPGPGASRMRTASNAGRLGVPVEGLDLPPREAHQRVAVPQRVVEEGEGVVPGQRRQPERQLGQVHGHRVLVHAVEAALGDQAAGVEDLVLVRRDVGTARRGRCQASTRASPSCRQASTRKAPEPMAGSQTLRSRICSGVAADRLARSRSRTGSSVVRTIGSVRAAACSASPSGGVPRSAAGPSRRAARGRAWRRGRPPAASAACRSSRVGGLLDRLGDLAGELAVGCAPRSHFLRLSPGVCAAGASRLTVVGAPCFFGGLMAIERPVAASRRKPIIVS